MADRLIVVGLDGFDIGFAERLMAAGRMPCLTRLRDRSARWRLDHGLAKYTGLAWEHVSTGKTPEALGRHSAVLFDPATYHVSQEPTHAPPIFAQFRARCVLFDVPYCDLHLAPHALGVARWGAHDPGAPQGCRPETLTAEMTERFGPYPATDQIYAMCWHSEAETRRTGELLAEAARVRARAAEWMLAERTPDWDLAMVVVSEPHSATEPLWHGVDPGHPLHRHASAAAAKAGLEAVYIETDALVGRLMDRFPDTPLMAFAMHGMGANGADLPAMVLLPELLYRHQFDKPHLRNVTWAGGSLADGTPLLTPEENWHLRLEESVPVLWSNEVRAHTAARQGREDARVVDAGIDYQPAARYRPFWPDMRAFAMPSFYDGRVRVNLAGRERYGTVSHNEYPFLIDELQTLIAECRDLQTGEPVVEVFHLTPRAPFDVAPTESDLYVHWRGLACGLRHPTLGEIGPIPFRRTGGHSGPHGFLYWCAPGLSAGDRGSASSFDVLPTIAQAVGEDVRALNVSGNVIPTSALA
jgi:predicted AlkP superfamily phosphohydrolase/phosphomutase